MIQLNRLIIYRRYRMIINLINYKDLILIILIKIQILVKKV